MNMEPIFISSDVLRIMPFEKKHFTQNYIDWLNDKEVVKYSELRHSTHTYDSCYQYWQSYQGSQHCFWAIEIYENSHWKHIGNINAYINTKNNIADIGILIGEKSVWGKGFGLIAWKAVCDYLFEKIKVRKITGGAMSNNHAMIKIMKKVGMIEDGRRTRHYLYNGKEVDILHYALFLEQKNDNL